MDRRDDERDEPRRAGSIARAARQAQARGATEREADMKATEIRTVHFGWRVEDRVATITLDPPERKNPLTFESYAALRDLFPGLGAAGEGRAGGVTRAGGNFTA